VAFALKIDKGEEREQTADKKPHVSVPSRRASTRHSRVESKRRKGGTAELSQNNVKGSAPPVMGASWPLADPVIWALVTSAFDPKRTSSGRA
jgi:hypothetical protein